MTYLKTIGLGLLVVALAIGCAEPPRPPKPVAKKDAEKKDADRKDDHDHKPGPNGGVVFDFGKYHAEFTVDHKAKECAVLILGSDEKTIRPIATKELTVTTKEAKTKDGKVVPAMTIKLLPKDEKDGKASKFVGTDPGLGNVADFEGTLIGEIDGKPATGEFKE
jgi:hypothetical protein